MTELTERQRAISAAQRDAQASAVLVAALRAAREMAGLSVEDVVDRLVKDHGSTRRRMHRLVGEYESGMLTHDAQLWFIHAYARAVGVRVMLSVVIA